ncbi:hypothetical protein OTU49_011584 [Cherax quadricarinatus]|uniref:Uncharacterized protein n=1 Tax=Cherax quadricarinatus TaxID=27406 RepID=A0AAW0W5P1_CHEQU
MATKSKQVVLAPDMGPGQYFVYLEPKKKGIWQKIKRFFQRGKECTKQAMFCVFVPHDSSAQSRPLPPPPPAQKQTGGSNLLSELQEKIARRQAQGSTVVPKAKVTQTDVTDPVISVNDMMTELCQRLAKRR